MQKFYMTPQEIDIITQIIKENDIKSAFEIIHNTGGGIGYTLDIEFEDEVNGRWATIRIPVTTVENW